MHLLYLCATHRFC